MQEVPPVSPSIEGNNSLSLLEIIAVVKHYAKEVLRYFWVLIIFMALVGGYLYYRKSKDSTTYTATLTFMLNEDVSTKTDMLGMLGVNFSMGETGGHSANLQKMEELMVTRRITKLTLFSKEKMKLYWAEPREDYLINHYLNAFWYKSPDLASGFYFKSDNDSTFTRQENSMLLNVHNAITQSHLKKYITAAGIMNMNFQSTSEEFSYIFTRRMFKCLEDYYFKQSIRKQELLYEKAKNRVDSLERTLGGSESAYYNYLNEHNNYTRQDVAIKQQRLNRRLQSEMETYLVSLKNREATKLALEQQVSSIQVIDEPIYPLMVFVPNPIMHLIIGAIVGFIMGTVLIIARRLLLDNIAKEKARKARLANLGSSELNITT